MSAPDGIYVELYAHPAAEPAEAFVLGSGLTMERVREAVRWRPPLARTRAFCGGLPVEDWTAQIPRHREVVLVANPAEPGSTIAAITAFFTALGDAAVSTVTLGSVGGAYAGASATGALGTAAFVGGAVGNIIGSAALAYGASAIVSSLTKAPSQDLGKNDGGDISPTLQDTGNQVRPYAPFPYIAGDFRLVPPICFPHSFVQGGESIFLALFIIGLGEHSFSVSDILVGDIPITSFDRAQIAIRQGLSGDPGLTLFTRNIFQAAISSTFDPIRYDDATLRSPWVQYQVPGEGHGKLGVDFTFTQGIIRTSNSGRSQKYGFGFQIEYRKNGGSWFDALGASGFIGNDPSPLAPKFSGNPVITSFQGLSILEFSGQSSRPFQSGFEWNVSGDFDDVWEVRIRRVETHSPSVLLGSGGSVAIAGQAIWFALKGFNFNSPPIQSSGVATVELKIPLDEQFSGLSQNVSVRARRKCRVYNPSAVGGADADGWSNQKFVTSNCAAIIRDVLQGVNNRKPATDYQIDVGALTSFYTFCETFNDGGTGALEFNHVFDARSDLTTVCQAIASAGRGRFGKDGKGRFTVIYDGPVIGAERYVINAANCRSFKILNAFPKTLNAIRAQYVDRDSGFDSNAELMVYRDGYSAGTVLEEEIETRSYSGTTSSAKAFARARYDIADSTLRPRRIEVEMDLEHLGIPTGALVRFSHPGLFVGQSWGRIKRATPSVYRDSFDSVFHLYSASARVLTNLAFEKTRWGDFAGGSVVHGDGAGVVVTNSTGMAQIDQTLGVSQNWSGCRFDIHVLPPADQISSTDGFRVRLIGPTVSDYKEWKFGSSAGLSSSSFLNPVGAILSSSATSASGGSFDATSVIGWSLRFNVVSAAADKTWRLDNFNISRTDGLLCGIELDQSVLMSPLTTYAMEHRSVDATNVRNDITRRDVRTLTSYGIAVDGQTNVVYLQTPISPSNVTCPAEGQLYSFGPSSTVSIRTIVRDKVSGSELSARVLLVDEAPGIHASTGTLPAFVPGTTLLAPIGRVGPAAPVIRQVITDERALAVAADGTLRPRIILSVAPGIAAGRPPADFWSLRYRRVAPTASEGVALPRVDATTSQIILDDVDEGATYDITLQGISRQGLVSVPQVQTVIVVGKTGTPPDVVGFRIEGTNLRWSLDDPPADLAGFRISRNSPGGTFTQSFSIHGDTLVSGPPFSVESLDSGLAQLFIVAVDTIGNVSKVPAELLAFVGQVPQQNVVNTIDIAAAGFPIVNQEENILNGFEDLIEKEIPDQSLDVIYVPEDTRQISILQGYDNVISRLNVERTLVSDGVRALRVTDLSVTYPDFEFIYETPQNRDKSTFAFRFRGDKPTGTWDVFLGLYDPDDLDKNSFYMAPAVITNSYQYIFFDLDSLTSDYDGANGPVNLRKIGKVELLAVHSSFAVGDSAIFDELQWIGGALNGVEVISGQLVNQINAGEFWSNNPSAPFWDTTTTNPFWAGVQYLDGIYEWTSDVSIGDVPCDLRIEISDPGVPYQILYRLEGGSTFVPFPGVLENVPEGTHSFQLHLVGGLVQGVVSTLNVILDVADERETVSNFLVASTGTVVLPITKTYREIRTVIGQPQGTGVAFPVVLTKASGGPSVIATDSSGTRIAKTMDWYIEGVKG